jgi:hypothetical protein
MNSDSSSSLPELNDNELTYLLEHARDIARKMAVDALWQSHRHGATSDVALTATAAAEHQEQFVTELELEAVIRQVRQLPSPDVDEVSE